MSEESHYGYYGPVCINTGQFDAGLCWLCEIKSHETYLSALRAELSKTKQEICVVENLIAQLKNKILERQMGVDQ